MWATNITSKCTSLDPSTRPSPLQRDVRLLVDRRRSWGWRSARGDPGNGRPMQCVAKTNHNLCCGSFSSPSLLPPPATNAHYTHTASTHPYPLRDSPTTTSTSKTLTRQLHDSAKNSGERELRTMWSPVRPPTPSSTHTSAPPIS